jgi:hypothetical protein
LLRRIESLVEHLSHQPVSNALLVKLIRCVSGTGNQCKGRSNLVMPYSQLQATSGEIDRLLVNKKLRYDVIAASITQCSARVNSYLLDCVVSGRCSTINSPEN